MNFKTILWPLLLKIARVLLTNIGTAISTFLVARNLISSGDQLTFVNLLADCAPALLGMLPGAALQLWVWFNSFTFVAKIEKALHLPITGRPSDQAVFVAAATAGGVMSTVSDPARPVPPAA